MFTWLDDFTYNYTNYSGIWLEMIVLLVMVFIALGAISIVSMIYAAITGWVSSRRYKDESDKQG
jgi:DMSO/TMAO reductase YedYZ heme-binding membrane subunit